MRRGRMAAAAVLLLAAAMAAAPASGQQVATSCTATLITTFTPCLNFITGSTNGGGSPTQGCCSSVAEMVRTGADCFCLILTGNVPFSLPINRTLAISLTRLCGGMSVPLQCRDTATQIPAPAPIPPESSVQPEPDSPAASPAVDSPPFSQRPVVVPSSAWSSHVSLAAVAILLPIAASIFV
ncbi:hypothetical protein HU200_029762 [Digitaria exilis]|uniref:Bifunctional inhibitor/plant lipid transfer protein/seed storage helical domain-containing protein n=1 Tax=Digitaria exilis TaxID=1010633 RepID=A0A835BT41_9POAL|nr:hypothetical protein HU200_029762 [Digitaria exilis]CAB3497897.1 unnamed protein product [Digitaria exilis]